VFQKQIMMRRVIYALMPLFLYSVYLYGWRSPLVLVISLSGGIVAEYLFVRNSKKKVSEAVLVSSTLYALSLPPDIPLWIVPIGIIFGVVFGKMVYGGFGRNVFNPAIAARLFIYISFPGQMTSRWLTPGRFGTIDTVSSATPLELLKGGESLEWLDLLIGNRAGSLGESGIILIILAAIYLIYTKTASWKIIVSSIGSFGLLSAVLYFSKVPGAVEPLSALMAGSALFVFVFMATDPVTAPKQAKALWLYGIMIGLIACIVRTFSLFPEGTSFGILVGNTFAAFVDGFFQKKKKAKGAAK